MKTFILFAALLPYFSTSAEEPSSDRCRQSVEILLKQRHQFIELAGDVNTSSECEEAYEQASQKMLGSFPQCDSFSLREIPEMSEIVTPDSATNVSSALANVKSTTLLILKAKCNGLARSENGRQRR